jgi:alpha-N-arabinofuranosidase
VTGVPYLKLSAVHDGQGGLTLFVLNRDLQGEMRLNVEARSFAALTVVAATTLHDADLDAVNTKEAPDRIAPQPLAGIEVTGTSITATLPPASWSVIRLRPAE